MEDNRLKASTMFCLAAFSGIGLTGCMNSQSLPPSPTVKTSRAQTPIAQSAKVDSAVRQVSAETPPPNTGPQVRLASRTSKSTPANPWKPKVKERKWKYVVMHHTASEAGSVRSIDAAHKQRRDSQGKPWLGIGYHFVIGNGHGMKDGEVQSTFRWDKQIHGAHAGVAAYNELGIGIVLVGNFENKRPTAAQLRSAKRLVKTLRTSYRITNKNIVTHGAINKTACPGRYFSLARITGVEDTTRQVAASETVPLTHADLSLIHI